MSNAQNEEMFVPWSEESGVFARGKICVEAKEDWYFSDTYAAQLSNCWHIILKFKVLSW